MDKIKFDSTIHTIGRIRIYISNEPIEDVINTLNKTVESIKQTLGYIRPFNFQLGVDDYDAEIEFCYFKSEEQLQKDKDSKTKREQLEYKKYLELRDKYEESKGL